MENGRHIVLATREMLDLLGRAKTWYIDSTFKAARDPFYQLMSVHVMVVQNDCLKQVPCCFALMSGKSTKDYKEVSSH